MWTWCTSCPRRCTGPGAKFAPVPDLALRSKDDPQFFTGSLWMMTSGSWQVRVTAEGAKGKGELSVPVPALSSSTKKMQAPIGILLARLGLLLLVGAVSIVGAGVREGQLEPGAAPDPARVRALAVRNGGHRGLRAGDGGSGRTWWKSEAGDYDKHIFKPLQMSATLENGGRLMLHLTDPGWARWRKVDDLVPDHNHLMHLYVISLPEMDQRVAPASGSAWRPECSPRICRPCRPDNTRCTGISYTPTACRRPWWPR